MSGDVMMALSAACVALALCGALLALRGGVQASGHLIAVLACLAGLTAFPLIAALNPRVAVIYMPILLPALMTLSPMVYAYVRARTAAQPLNRQDWPHGVLPLLGAVVALGVSAFSAADREALFVEGQLPTGWGVAALMLVTFALVVTAPFVSIGYLVASMRRLGRYRGWLKDQLSNVDKRELRWVEGFIASLVLLWMLTALALLSDNLGDGLWVSGEWVLAVSAITLVLLISFALIDERGTEPALPERTAPSYEKSGLADQEAADLAARIEAAMADDGLYLDPNLSLERLARHVRSVPDHVSQTLNAHMGIRFFDYVARWRIKAAKRALQQTNKSVLEIAIEVGFNTRSTFYTAFKRETGVTPSQYRQQHSSPD